MMPADVFWEALERVGSLALLAIVLYAVWKSSTSRYESECRRLDKLVDFTVSQVTQAHIDQAAYTESFRELAATSIQLMAAVNEAIQSHDDDVRENIIEMTEMLAKVLEVLDAGVDGQVRSSVQKRPPQAEGR